MWAILSGCTPLLWVTGGQYSIELLVCMLDLTNPDLISLPFKVCLVKMLDITGISGADNYSSASQLNLVIWTGFVNKNFHVMINHLSATQSSHWYQQLILSHNAPFLHMTFNSSAFSLFVFVFFFTLQSSYKSLNVLITDCVLLQ